MENKAGLLQLIAEYDGNPNAQDLRTTFCQLTDRLPPFIEDVPFEDLII